MAQRAQNLSLPGGCPHVRTRADRFLRPQAPDDRSLRGSSPQQRSHPSRISGSWTRRRCPMCCSSRPSSAPTPYGTPGYPGAGGGWPRYAPPTTVRGRGDGRLHRTPAGPPTTSDRRATRLRAGHCHAAERRIVGRAGADRRHDGPGRDPLPVTSRPRRAPRARVGLGPSAPRPSRPFHERRARQKRRGQWGPEYTQRAAGLSGLGPVVTARWMVYRRVGRRREGQ